MNVALTVGSLFSGIGGLDLGLERAGMRVLWQVECDPYARAVLRKHWPDAALYEDVREVGAASLAPVDLVCGGFPCQDISTAGKQAGINGERSGLWSEYVRIIREIRPRYVLVENVAALLFRGMGRVVGDLAASGYDAEWDCLPAAAFGAPHGRERLFLIAYPAGEGRTGVLRHVAPIFGESAAHWPTTPLDSRSAVVAAIEQRMGEPAFFGSDDGVPSRVDRLRCLGNAVVPQVAEYIGRLILAHAEAVEMSTHAPSREFVHRALSTQGEK